MPRQRKLFPLWKHHYSRIDSIPYFSIVGRHARQVFDCEMTISRTFHKRQPGVMTDLTLATAPLGLFGKFKRGIITGDSLSVNAIILAGLVAIGWITSASLIDIVGAVTGLSLFGWRLGRISGHTQSDL